MARTYQVRIHSALYDPSTGELVIDATVPGGEVRGYRMPNVATRDALALELAKAPVMQPYNMLTGMHEVDAGAFDAARASVRTRREAAATPVAEDEAVAAADETPAEASAPAAKGKSSK